MVSGFFFFFFWLLPGLRFCNFLIRDFWAGTHQILHDWRQCQHTDFPGEAGNGDVAGYMVLGVSQRQAEAEDTGYDSGGEDVVSECRNKWGCCERDFD